MYALRAAASAGRPPFIRIDHSLAARTSHWRNVSQQRSFPLQSKPHTPFARTFTIGQKIAASMPFPPTPPSLRGRVAITPVGAKVPEIAKRSYHVLRSEKADEHKTLMKKVAESLPVPRKINDELKKHQCLRISGAAGSGKTEQIQMALGKDHVVFDLREEFFKNYFKENNIPPEKQNEIRALYRTPEMKEKELQFLYDNRSKILESLAQAPEKTIVFDEFDLAYEGDLSVKELNSALSVSSIAVELKEKGKQIVLVLHHSGLKNAELTGYMETAGLITPDAPIINTQYLDHMSQSMFLDEMPLSHYERKRIVELSHGVPGVFLEMMRDCANVSMEVPKEEFRISEFKDLLKQSYKNMEMLWKLVKKTQSPEIIQTLIDLATKRIEIDDPRVLEHKDELLLTGLIGEPNGVTIMPKIAQDVIQNSLDDQVLKTKFTVEEVSMMQIEQTRAPAIARKGAQLSHELAGGTYLTRDFEGVPVFIPKNPYVIDELWKRDKAHIKYSINISGLPLEEEHLEHLSWVNSAVTPKELRKNGEAVKELFLELLGAAAQESGAKLLTGYDKATGEYKYLIKSEKSIEQKAERFKRKGSDPVIAVRKVNDVIRTTIVCDDVNQLNQAIRSFHKEVSKHPGTQCVYGNKWEANYSMGYVGVHANIFMEGKDEEGKVIHVRGEVQFHLKQIQDGTEESPFFVSHQLYELGRDEKFRSDPFVFKTREQAMKTLFTIGMETVPNLLQRLWGTRRQS